MSSPSLSLAFEFNEKVDVVSCLLQILDAVLGPPTGDIFHDIAFAEA